MPDASTILALILLAAIPWGIAASAWTLWFATRCQRIKAERRLLDTLRKNQRP